MNREELDRKAHTEAIADGAPTTCMWIVHAPSNNPEPSCEADRWDEIECGAEVTYDHGGFSCTNGHDHRTYGGPEHTEYFDADELRARSW
tara:strand:+ start:4035 stop:4304 length:270 start_codon:yes stop_codon:yes gene_type:complete